MGPQAVQGRSGPGPLTRAGLGAAERDVGVRTSPLPPASRLRGHTLIFEEAPPPTLATPHPTPTHPCQTVGTAHHFTVQLLSGNNQTEIHSLKIHEMVACLENMVFKAEVVNKPQVFQGFAYTQPRNGR